MIEIKKIKTSITVIEYYVVFDYDTWRGHQRTQSRILKAISKEQAKKFFKDWASEQRAMNNVKILSIAETNREEIINL